MNCPDNQQPFEIIGFPIMPREEYFHVLSKPAGPLCNLDCRYCFYLDKKSLFPGSTMRMDEATLEAHIRQVFEGQPDDLPEVTFAWQGGEPTLLGVDFFGKAVEYIKKHHPPHKDLNLSIQTNGVLLDDEWGKFLAENKFLVGLSIDGPEQLHDRFRVDRQGKPTFDKVMQGLEILKKHQVEFNTLTCVHRYNSYQARKVYDFLVSIGSRFHQYIPILEQDAEGKIEPCSVEPEQYGRFLNKIFDRWLEREDVGRVFIRDFDNTLAQVMGYPATVCVTAETCGRAVALEHNGMLYSCDHFVRPEFELGNIHETPIRELVDSDKQKKFGQDKKDKLTAFCCRCEFLFVCGGGCPKDRVIDSPDSEPGHNYFCEGYLRFYAHTLPVFRAMAECLKRRRPASEYQEFLVRKNK
jgi:uncharacterized protein